MYMNRKTMKVSRQATAHSTFFNAVLEVKANPDEYTTLTINAAAKKLTDKLGAYVSDSRVQEIFKCAEVERRLVRKSKSKFVKNGYRGRDLCRAFYRTLIKAGFNEADIDPYIVRVANEECPDV